MPDPMNAADYSDASDPNSALAQALMNRPNYLNPAYISPEMLADLRARGASYLKPPEAKSWTGAIGQTLGALASNRMAAQAAMLDQAKSRGTAGQFDKANFGGDAASGTGSPVAGAGTAQQVSGGASDTAQGVASSFAPALGPAGAAGLAGNWYAESGFNPGAVGDGKQSIGMAQWRDDPNGGKRRSNLIAFATKNGASPTDPNIQKKFALVEMGLAGDQSDPGFGSEAAAGQALKAARTPQEATAAALMYERPGGYSAAHPERSNAYGKRLSMATALMGGQGGSGASPTAYADGGPAGSAMPPVGPGAGTQVSLGAGGGRPGNGPMPAGAPAGPNVMAQNAPQGGSPMVGMGARQIGAIMANPNVPEHIKLKIMEGQVPGAIATPGGGTVMQAPLQPVKPQTVSPGVLEDVLHGQHDYAPATGAPPKTLIPGGLSTVTQVGDVSVPGFSTGTPGQPLTTQQLTPGMGPSSFTGRPGAAPAPAAAAPELQPGQKPGPLGSWVDSLKAMSLRNKELEAGATVTGTGDAAQNQESIANTPRLRNAGLSLKSMQDVLESNKGILPTGPLGTDAAWAAGIANMFHLGDPKLLSNTEQFQKKAMEYAQTQAKAINASPTNFDLEGTIKANPGLGISNQGNRILTDYLVHQNGIQQKYEEARQSFYQQNRTMQGFQKAWDDATDQNPLPLTRFPSAKVTKPDGTTWYKYQTTARKGYTWSPQDFSK
jgi:hypothetical protein